MRRNIFYVLLIVALVFTGSAVLTSTSSVKAQSDVTLSPDASTTLVLSQVYGGGGGSTGTYLFDYIEIKNISSTSQSLNGLSLVYGSATGQFASTTTNAFALPDVTLAPGRYYLVQTSGTGTAGAPLPVTPDATTGNLTISGASGKVALVTAAFTQNNCGATATPCTLPAASIIDVVSFGVSNNAEGNAPTNAGAALTSVQGNVRKGNGCTDTDNNNNDFDIVTNPVPRNTSSAAVLCTGGASPTPTATATATPAASPTPTATATPSGSPTPTPSGAGRRFFSVRLNGAQEVPANTSTARGYGRVVLNAAETQITASFYFENLSSNSTAGHIHGNAGPTATAPVLFDMAPPTGVTRGQSVDKVFTVTAQQVADLRAGLWYFNVHSVNFPNGEIRGQIVGVANDAPLDLNGDGRTDFGVVRQTAATGGTQARWFTLTNSTPAVENQVDFGVTTDSITPGDFDGDGKDDIAVWRAPSSGGQAFFYILQSSTNTLRTVRFGLTGDDPFVIADYDGDGVDDPAIFRKSNILGDQAYFWWYGSYGVTRNAEVPVPWGSSGDGTATNSGDSAVPGDFNGDGKADFCVYRGIGTGTAARGAFLIHYGTGGFDAPSSNDTNTRFGLANDTIVPGDFDGDGKTDFSISRPEGAGLAWYVTSSLSPTTYSKIVWGRSSGDTEVQGDYDGDGKTDYAVWRGTVDQPSVYYILRSADQSVQYQRFGVLTDVPAAQDTHNQ